MGLSAKRLGERIGLNAEQTNTLLKDENYIEGDVGYYSATEKGKTFAEEKYKDNGYGGYGQVSYEWLEWDESILNNIDTSSENLESIRNLTSQKRKERKTKKEQEYKKYQEDLLNEQEYESEYTFNYVQKITKILLVAIPSMVALYKIYKNKKLLKRTFNKDLENENDTV